MYLIICNKMFYFSHIIIHQNLAINCLNAIQLATKASLMEIRERLNIARSIQWSVRVPPNATLREKRKKENCTELRITLFTVFEGAASFTPARIREKRALWSRKSVRGWRRKTNCPRPTSFRWPASNSLLVGNHATKFCHIYWSGLAVSHFAEKASTARPNIFHPLCGKCSRDTGEKKSESQEWHREMLPLLLSNYRRNYFPLAANCERS